MRQEKSKKNDITYVFEHIWKGGLPQLFHADEEQRQEYFNSYINTYIMRDAAYLAMWPSWETLMNGAASGHYFENFIVMELRKSFAYSQKDAYMTYYRDSNAKEIDILLQVGNEIHPLEIKKTAKPDRRDVVKFAALEKALLKQGSGGIICLCEEAIPIDSMNCFIPSNLI